jgi:two-component system cell cycle sensor histidine kinase/response regulator CckA
MSLFPKMKRTDNRTRSEDQVGRFHTRQALSMIGLLTVLVAAFFIMLARQYNLSQKHEEELLTEHFKERAAYLDNLLVRVTEHIDGMRIAAETDLFQSRAVKAFDQPLEFEDLTDADDGKRYHLDTFKPPITREMIGNLTGQGTIYDRDRDFYREIRMALNLNPLFQDAAGAIKHSAWIYYTSQNDFINIYPWVSSADFKFSKELHTHEFYTFGLPATNPDRKRFWTKVYVDEYGKGLMTTCAAPVYDQDRFIGTVAIDLTVDFLNSVVRQFRPKEGVMFLINDRDQLLAHPTLITSGDKKTKALAETLPGALSSSIGRFMQIRDNELTRMHSFNILRSHLIQAPWQVIYVEPVSSFWSSFIDLIGIGPVTVLGMLLILVVALFVVTQARFILPSKKLVNYIMARSLGKQMQTDQRIPRIWKSWFAAVEKVFEENEELTQALQKQNENLEQRVRQRTVELEKEIEERRQVQETLRESEERFRDISYSMADWIWEVDKNGRYTFATETVKQILGYDPQELMGKSPFELMPEDEARRVERIFKTIASEKNPIVDLENWNLSKDGKKVCLQTNAVPMLDEKGELIGYRGVDKDITDRKLADEEQKKLEAQLHRAQKMEAMGLLAGGVAHDLNNILSGIVSYPELLLMDLPEDSPLRKPIETIKESGMRAADVVADLLTIARGVATGKEALNLNTIVSEYLGSSEFDNLEKTHAFVDFRTELDSDLLNMSGSSIHVKKVLMNLVVNAAEAIEGSGTVIISTGNRYLDEPVRGYEDVRQGEYVVLSVSDDGSGISPEDIERIFEPFYTKKVMGRSGTGLGLAVVWNTVQDHNGYISVKSSEKGTAFELHFPVTREKIADEKEPVDLQEYLGHGEKILVVDDEERQREIACGMLTKLGYNPQSVSSGEEAIEYVKEHPVDLIVLDMIMPKGINGRETYEEIIKVRPGQKAIIASGFAKTREVDAAQDLGAGTYIKKPYILEKIGVAVKRELEK